MNHVCSGCLCEELWLLLRAVNAVQNNGVEPPADRGRPRNWGGRAPYDIVCNRSSLACWRCAHMAGKFVVWARRGSV